MCGIRLVIDEFRSDVTKTLKNGQRGRLRIDYGDPHKPGDAVKWLWKFVDGAKTAGELYGRALVVIAAEQYASRLVVPQSQRSHPTRWSSHKDHAAKALRKLAGPHLPASLKELEKAIARAHREHDTAVQRAQAQAAARPRRGRRRSPGRRGPGRRRPEAPTTARGRGRARRRRRARGRGRAPDQVDEGSSWARTPRAIPRFPGVLSVKATVVEALRSPYTSPFSCTAGGRRDFGGFGGESALGAGEQRLAPGGWRWGRVRAGLEGGTPDGVRSAGQTTRPHKPQDGGHEGSGTEPANVHSRSAPAAVGHGNRAVRALSRRHPQARAARVVNTSAENVEDACMFAWTKFLSCRARARSRIALQLAERPSRSAKRSSSTAARAGPRRWSPSTAKSSTS